jgi:aldehyde dehydrogenase (NAD+)
MRDRKNRMHFLCNRRDAAVLGTDLQRARRVASQIRAGRVVINNMTDDPQAPWGGFKYSGIGREYGRYGIEAFLEPYLNDRSGIA